MSAVATQQENQVRAGGCNVPDMPSWEPDDIIALNRQGGEALKAKQYERAERIFTDLCQAIDNPAAYVNLAIAISKQGRKDEALDILEKLHHVDARIIEASIHEECGDNDMALRCIEAGLEIDPNDTALRFARGQQLLSRGQWREGWREYEYRTTRLELLEKMDEYPEWNGQPLTRGRLLIVGEQGVGDQIMFSRYIRNANIAARGDTRGTHAYAGCIFYTRPELARLLQSLPCPIVTDGREFGAEEIGAWIAIGSLPYVLGIDEPLPALPTLIPAARPPVRLADSTNLRVGICWSGNPQHRKDEFRSMRFADMDKLLGVTGVDFYAFQGGEAAKQNDGRAVDLIPYCHDFADTAALLKQMDLVITVDTALLHLAGTLGVRTWAIIGKPPDWRWGSRSRWYDSVALSANVSDGPKEFGKVIEKCHTSLHEATAAHHGSKESSPRATSVTHEPTAVAQTYLGPIRYFTMDRWIGRSLSEYGDWSHGEVELFEAFIKAGDRVIDGGGNIGMHAIALAECVGIDGMVVSFEPHPVTFAVLEANTMQYPQIHCLHVGLSDRSGTIENVVFHAAHPAGFALTTIAEREGAGQDVTVTTLDAMGIERVDFIKFDIEGLEELALRGAENTIARNRPILYVECDKPGKEDGLFWWLFGHDYKVYRHMPTLFRRDNPRGNRLNIFGNIVSGMLLCVPSEKYFDIGLIEKLGLERMRIERQQ